MMGMYSTVVECDLTPVASKRDAMGRWLASISVPEYIPEEYQEEYMWWKKELLRLMPKNERDASYCVFDEVFDDKKILGYWYPSFGYFLRDLAQFVEGCVIWQSECGNERVCATFEDGVVRFEGAEWKWSGNRSITEDWFRDVKPLPPDEAVLRRL